jgi:hypothetical protein
MKPEIYSLIHEIPTLNDYFKDYIFDWKFHISRYKLLNICYL